VDVTPVIDRTYPLEEAADALPPLRRTDRSSHKKNR
jgi:hypothetical protein